MNRELFFNLLKGDKNDNIIFQCYIDNDSNNLKIEVNGNSFEILTAVAYGIAGMFENSNLNIKERRIILMSFVETVEDILGGNDNE